MERRITRNFKIGNIWDIYDNVFLSFVYRLNYISVIY